MLFVFFPIIVFLLSYTRFFNNQVRDLLTSIVDDGTNARLHLGEIHGSVFGSFTIDGAALLYHDQPIAMVDTIRISHLPLSLITKTIQATRVELVNPRFYLVRGMDGIFNIDHIGKPGNRKGGKFDWTILARSLSIRNGQFLLYDSTVVRTEKSDGGEAAGDRTARFDPRNFSVRNLDLAASAELSGDNLSVNVRNMSMGIDPPGLSVDSLRFAFFTSRGGTEVSGFRLWTGRTLIHVDVTLTGQDLLDSLDENIIRNKYLTANIEAVNCDPSEINGFVKVPFISPTRFSLSAFASGTLDTLTVKQFLLRTDSSIVPISASFRNLLDSSMTMDVTLKNAGVDMGELSAILKNVGFPNAGRLKKMNIDASASGRPLDLSVSARLSNEKTEIAASSSLNHGTYVGQINFHGLNIGDIIGDDSLKTGLNGTAAFSLATHSGTIPSGVLTLEIDSSSSDHTSIPSASVKITSSNDSIASSFNFLTSRGNVDGQAGFSTATNLYFGDISFTEFDVSPFVHVPSLAGSITGRLLLEGRGFNIDSLRTSLSLLTERSSLGKFHLDNSAFTLLLNTERPEKELQVHSPYFDASITGGFVPHELPAQISGVISAIADSFSSRLSGRVDTIRSSFTGTHALDVDVDADVKDARILGQLLGRTEMSGNASTHLRLVSGGDSVSISGFLSVDTLDYARDSLRISGSKVYVGFNYSSDPGLSVWDSASWSTDASIGSLNIGRTRLAAKELHVRYSRGDSSASPRLSLHVEGQVDTLVEFGIEASGSVLHHEFTLVTDSLRGKVYGIPLVSESPVHISYSPETFSITPATFLAGMGSEDSGSDPRVTVNGSYSLQTGANLHFLFSDFGLGSIQQIARLDTNNLKLSGSVSGRADLDNVSDTTVLSLDFSGKNVGYNGSMAKRFEGSLELSGQVMSINVELSKNDDSSRYSLTLIGTIPLSARSHGELHLDMTADSQDVSFLTPFMTGVDDFGGTLSGNMAITGSYSSPEMKGKLVLDDGRIRLAANEVDYLYTATIIGEGNKLFFSPLAVMNLPGQNGGTLQANGSITIGRNTIEKFDLVLDGSLLVLNSTARRTLKSIYGTATVGAGKQGLLLGGSLDRLMLSGTLNIQSADLTLLPMRTKEDVAAQEIIYHFPENHKENKGSDHNLEASVVPTPPSSGSILDSLRYDVEVETKDNVNLRMIFNPVTNEELSAVLGGRLHLSNMSGSMELTGDVSVQNSSYYNFYSRHFAASGRLSFTGNPLNPTLNITAQYQGEHTDTSSTTGTGRTENVVVQLGISGTFNRPNPPDISMTRDGIPYQGDAQTNAISFILTGQFADELTSPLKRTAADNLWSQAGAGILTAGTSILSGAMTNFFSREFSFIRSAELRYSSISGLTNPDVAITTQFGKATVRVGGQFSDINNTEVNLDYPIADLLGNMLYLQLSRKVGLNNRNYQREAVNALKLMYQMSF